MGVNISRFFRGKGLGDFVVVIVFNFAFRSSEPAQAIGAQKYLSDGKAAFEKDDYDAAISNLNKAVHADPKSADALCYRGASYFAKNQIDEALADFNQAVAVDPKFDAAYVGIGRVYSNRNESGKAIQAFNKAIEINPKNGAAIENRATENLTKDGFEAMVGELEKVAEIFPDFGVYMYIKGHSDGQGDPHHMISLATTFINDAHTAAEIRSGMYLNRAIAYTAIRNFDKAIDDATKAIDRAPNFVGYSVRTEIYTKQLIPFFRDMDSGMKIDRQKFQALCQNVIADSSDALRLAPPVMLVRAQLLESRSGCYLGLGDYDRAMADYSKINTIYSKPTYDGYRGRAKAYVLKGEYDKAIADFTKSLDFPDPLKNIFLIKDETYFGRGKAYLQKGDFEKAVADFTAAIEIDLESNVLYRVRAEAYLKKGDYDNAIADATTSIAKFESRGVMYGSEFSENGFHAYRVRAQAYRKMGKTALANADEKKAIELETESEKGKPNDAKMSKPN